MPILMQRRRSEISPAAVTTLLDCLLRVDRPVGVAELRREAQSPVLSDYARARLVGEHGVAELGQHLVDLFVESESAAFRNFLFETVVALPQDRTQTQRLVLDMNSHVNEEKLRARIAAYLRSTGS
jgi:hypothetical protein